ncbi:MAG: hydantoinase B/oxoprolinase family protein, partial [Chloroflexi bacterium]|nr:hydantoinase B/oxoprolinase family protein [Chloroflexota bacterium]
DPTAAVNHGAWRPLHTVAPEGSFLNARLPAACGGMAEARYAADTAMMGALAAAVPDLATGDNKGCANHLYIGGHDAKGQLFIFYEYPAGGTGGYEGGDGQSAMRNWQEGDFSSLKAVEAVENEHPMIVERCEMRRDSAGAGRWRGGFGLRRDVRLLAERAVLSVLTDRNILGPHGVCGGEAGAGNRFTVRRGGTEIEPSPIPGKVTGFALQREDVIVMRSAGGGGYGDPLERDPALVWHDVAEGYVSAAAARARYGVVVTETGVDMAATVALRAALRERRPQVTLAAWDASEYAGARRVLPLARGVAQQAGIAEGDVVELVPPRRAPLRAWARLVDEAGDRAYLGPQGLTILGMRPGARVDLRRLTAWAPPPVDS